MKTIYYGTKISLNNLDFQLRGFEPEPVKYSNFMPNLKNLDIVYDKCPANIIYRKNLFSIKSPIDYNLRFDANLNMFRSDSYDQKFYDSVVFVRSIPAKLISFNILYYFFTEEKELNISQEQASFHTNNFIDNTIIIPGKFDLGKYPRPLEMAFHMKRNIEFSVGDDLYYIRFHTDKNLTFKKFLITDRYDTLANNLLDLKHGKKSFKNLNYYYDLFNKHAKYKKLMLDEIKNNLMD